MIDLLMLFLLCFACSYMIRVKETIFNDGVTYNSIWGSSKKWVVLIAVFLILFAGLRTSYNDTGTYRHIFVYDIDVSNFSISDIFASYGGWDSLTKTVKIFGLNFQWYLIICAFLCVVLYLRFIIKHSERIPESFILYLIGPFVFCMGGMKQAVSIAVALYAIEAFLEKRYVKSAVLLLVAMSFHPYIICLISVIFLTRNVWSKRTVFVIIVAVVLFLNLELVFSFFSAIGKDFSSDSLYDYTINPIRVIIEAIPVLLSLFYRDNINNSGDNLLILSCNMQIISFLFLATGLVINPIYPGRMATYFSMLYCITTPKLLEICFEGNYKRILKFAYYAFFFLYFILDFLKLGSISIMYDQFKHTSFSSLFR